MRLLDLFEDHNHPERGDVRWAVGKHLSRATRVGTKDQNDPDYALVWGNIKDIMDNAVPNMALDLNDPMGGKNRIGQRVPNAKLHWSGGNYMDPSLIYMRGSKVDFQDGRHRLVAAYQLGHRYAPVLVDREGLSAFQKVVRVRQDEALIEAQMIQIPVRTLGARHIVKVWKNPTLSQTRALVNRIQQVRALDDRHGNFYLWDARDSYHGAIRRELGLGQADSTRLYMTPQGVASDYLEWNQDPDYVINGIGVWAEDDEYWRTNKGTVRALGSARITEDAKSFEITMSHHGGQVRVWKNPTRSQTQALVERLGEVRAISTMNGDFYLWPAFQAIHETVAKELGVKGVRFFLTPIEGDKEASEWTGPPLEINGIWAWAEPGAYAAWKYPGTVRALGPARRSRYPKNWKEDIDESLHITEAQSFEVVLGDHGSWRVRVWKNPTASETRALVDRFKEARGMAEGADFYLWEAFEAIHSTIAGKLGFQGVRFYLTPVGYEKYATEWDGKPETYNGLWVWASDEEGWGYPGVQRALGMTQPQLPQRQMAAESARMQVVQNPFDHNKEYRVWVNPVASQTRALVHQLGQVRAICTGKNLYLWNANDATHADMEYALDKGGERLYMVPKGGKLEAPEWEGPPDQIVNGIEVWATWAKTTLKLPGVARALGLPY